MVRGGNRRMGGRGPRREHLVVRRVLEGIDGRLGGSETGAEAEDGQTADRETREGQCVNVHAESK